MTRRATRSARAAAGSLVVVVAVVGVAGCGVSGHARVAPRAVDLTAGDNGRTIGVAVGTPLRVTLPSTYWTISSSSVALLPPLGDPLRVRASCRPGAGCGTTRQLFTAWGVGTAALVGARTTCGEALRCTDAAAGYKVHVIVRP